jgi:unsaturated rhamnogalacturonyl hydrolase
MSLVNNYFRANWPNPCTNCLTGSRPSNIWTRGVFFEGLMAHYAVQPDTALYNYAVRWGTFHSWNLRSGDTTTNADNQCCGQTYIDLYGYDSRVERITPIKTCADRMVNGAAVNNWWWIDAIQMAMPVFTKLGVVYNDSRYFTKMYNLYDFTKTTQRLYNISDHLWWRDSTFKPPYTTPNGKNCYWSRGNGWVFAALARVLSSLPAIDPHRAEYVQVFTDMAVAIKAVQRTDGFWNESLADPNHYGGKEVTGTALFAYGMAWGVNYGLLELSAYLPAVAKAWNGIADSAIHTDGFLGYVQGTGSKPGDMGSTTGYPTYNYVPDFDDYGVGCVLLAGSEIAKLTDIVAIDRGKSSISASKQPAVHFDGRAIRIDNSDDRLVSIALYNAKGQLLFQKNCSGAAGLQLPSFIPSGIVIACITINGTADESNLRKNSGSSITRDIVRVNFVNRTPIQ